MSTYDPAALECLAAIVEEGGFERAAQRLNVTQSAVSQRLRALEAQVGSVLIVRSRPLRPTSAGQLLLKHTKQMRLPLEIIVDDQDFTQEWLRSGQVLGCVTTLKQALRGCKMVPLGAMHYVAVASASYAEQYLPQGLTPHNFREVSFLSFNRKDDMAAEFVARAFG